jgi:tetratricopeptide (TPR) repeat protein
VELPIERAAKPVSVAREEKQHRAVAGYRSWLAELYVRQALVREKMRDWPAAASAYEAALARKDGKPQWHFRLGRAREKMRDWAAAASAYEVALAQQDGKPQWYLRLARAREKLQDWAAAASAYEAALALGDGKAKWFFRLGLTREKIRDWAAAASAYEAAVTRDRSKAKWQYRLSLAREKATSTAHSRLDDKDVVLLASIERQVGLGSTSGRRPFWRLERWVIADEDDVKRIDRLGALLPRLIEARRQSAPTLLPLSCCAVYVGGGGTLRSFYPSTGVTIKIFCSEAARQRAHNELEARSLIAQAGKLSIPQVSASSMDSSSAYIMEEMVTGRHPAREVQLRAFVAEVWETYQALGFSLTECLPWFTLEAIKEELGSVPIPPHMRYEQECRNELVRRLERLPDPRERPLLAGFGHGDLSLGNIMVTDTGKWFILDWECSGRIPVAWDLGKLIVSAPRLLPQITHLISTELQRKGWGYAMAAENQCLVALAGRIASRSLRGRETASSEIISRTIKSFRPVKQWLEALA